jgi:DNA-binding GntR family transcriptional regulator
VTTAAKPTRTEAVFESVRDEVLSARIPPGTKMKLADYSQRFNVSLAVVREALGRLAEQGLLQANPQRGFSTLPLSVEDLLELTRARVIIETATLRESIARGDLSWEASVVATHHQLASTPRYDGNGTINAAFAVAHRAFHVALLAGSANSPLESVAASLRDRSELYQYWSHYLGDDPNRDVVCEHRELAELTVARDADNAAAALTRHIQRTTDSLAQYASRSGAV